jgi:hypothetical protein
VLVHASAQGPAGQKVLDKGGIRCEVCSELFTASASA